MMTEAYNRQLRKGRLVGILAIIISALGLLLVAIDSFTYEEIRTKEKVKCIDAEGNDFVDEYCFKIEKCSSLGIIELKKCSEVKK